MKIRYSALIVVLAAVAFPFATASAGDPNWVKLDYDKSSKAFKVRIHHLKPCKECWNHIARVDIKIISKPYKTYSYTYNSHSPNNVVKYTYNDIEAAKGDIIEVIATSAAFEGGGSKSSSITVGQ